MPFDGDPPLVRFYAQWSEAEDWRWSFFAPQELACRGTGELLIDEALLDMLQATRIALGQPMVVNSGYRSPAHNRRVGGAKRSFHVRGMAADIATRGVDAPRLVQIARAYGAGGVGVYGGFRHLDAGPVRHWSRI